MVSIYLLLSDFNVNINYFCDKSSFKLLDAFIYLFLNIILINITNLF